MGVIKKFNPETGQWEIYGSTDAKDINLIDVNNNFSDKSVEGALREISNKLSETTANLKAHSATLVEHTSNIAWLKENGGGGGGGGGGAAAPTITSTFEDGTIVKKDEEVKIPIFFASPNLGEGSAYIIVDGIEVAIIPGLKQGNNTINIGKLTNLSNKVSIYVKDRMNLLSNQLNWTIIAGGLDLEITFDDTADYYITDMIMMQFDVRSASTEPIIMHMTIDYDEFEIECEQGFNEYIFPELGIGIHRVSCYVTSGLYSSSVYDYNIVIVSSNSLYVSSSFKGGEFVVGTPIPIQYRISKASKEEFTVNMYLNNRLEKTAICQPGTYYWTLNDLDIDNYKVKIEVIGTYDEPQLLELEFDIVSSGYEPIKITEQGLQYRLNARGRTNQDFDREFPIDDSGNEIKTTLHNFNFFTNGWIDDELVCDSNAYVEIDFKPWENNAIYGSTIEIQFTSIDIGLIDARIIDYTDVNTPKGFYVDIESAKMSSAANNGLISVDKDIETTLTFIIDRRNKFGKIFINGICSRAFFLSDTGSGVNAVREDFSHSYKIYLNSKKGESHFGACKIKDVRIYGRVLSDDEIVTNYIAQERNLEKQEKLYNFNYNNTTLPVIRMYGDDSNMTLETPVKMRIKYTSPNEDLYGQSFDLPYCDVCWQGTSSLQYVLKNFTARLKDENMAVYNYTPYRNGIPEDTYCFKADYMESTHARNVGIAKFVNECLYDTKNPMQLKDPNIRNTVNGFPCLMYINDELQGVYNFNLDRYSTKSYGYTEDTTLVYEVTANSDTTAGAFYKWTENSGKDKLSYYKSDFACLYPPTRAAGNDNMSELIRLIEWVNDSSDEDFKDNFSRYFNLEYVLRYYLFVLVFGAVDSLGKNMKLTTWDGLIWYPQIYDADTTIGLDNTGFLKFDMDIEMGDEHVFNTTGSVLWRRVVLLFQEELKREYALMRQDRFTVDNIMKYLYDEQISKIPAVYYNKDMQTKYLDYESSYLYALHGNGEQHIKKWIRERIVYVDSLLGYMVEFDKDKITLRSSKIGEVYIDLETYIPMYVTVKWRNEDGGTGIQTKRVGRGEVVRFTYNMPTATDQEILVYGGYYLKRLGNLSNLEPTYMLIANAKRLTEIECHSPNLIVTDLSQCEYLQRIDISNCTALGTGIGAETTLNIENCKYLRYCDCRNTKLTAIYTMQAGGNLEEIYFPNTTQIVRLTNQTYLRVLGLPIDSNHCKNLDQVEITNCHSIEYMHYPYSEGDSLSFESLRYVQNLILNNSLDKLEYIQFTGFDKLTTLELNSMHNIKQLGFNNMMRLIDEPSLSSVKLSDCPLIDTITFNVDDAGYKIQFLNDAIIDLSGLQSVSRIEANTPLLGAKTLIVPNSIKDIIFNYKFGDGSKSILENIWSGLVNHASDGYSGIDLLGVDLRHITMNAFRSIRNAKNIHLSPIDIMPRFNNDRDNMAYAYIEPEGTIDLTKYTGSMEGMFKGMDMSKLNVIVTGNRPQQDLTSLFEGAKVRSSNTISGKDLANSLIKCYPFADVWDKIFKNATLDFNTNDVEFPTDKFISTSDMFRGSNISEDLDLTPNFICVDNMFRDCKNLKTYLENWNKEDYFDPEMTTSGCYFNSGGDLEFVPPEWGGYGFYPEVTSEIVVNIPYDNYELILCHASNKLSIGVVNWGDENITFLEEDNYKHIYKTAGVYRIKGHFTFGNACAPNSSLTPCITKVEYLATDTSNLGQAFKACKYLTSVNLSMLNINNLSETFSGCQSLNEIDFAGTTFNGLTNMTGTFNGCSRLKSLDLTIINTENVTNMSYLFSECTTLTELNISNLVTDNVTNMKQMFAKCEALETIDVKHFNTEKVENMNGMFKFCKLITTLDISNFVTDKVQDFGAMFDTCESLTSIDVSGFNTEKATSMENMFNACIKLESLDLSNFVTSNVKSMARMFQRCALLQTLDLSSFDTSNVTNITYMFTGCSLLKTLILGTKDFKKIKDVKYLFSGCSKLAEVDFSETYFEAVESYTAMFINCNALTSLNLSNFNTSKATTMKNMFSSCSGLTSLDLSNFDTALCKDMEGMFNACSKLTDLTIPFVTTSVNTMKDMFRGCRKLTTLDLSTFDTKTVVNMEHMFSDCVALKNLDVSHFYDISLSNVKGMFKNCAALTDLNLGTLTFGRVTNFDEMFSDCDNLTILDLSNFNTSKATSMYRMFHSCTKLSKIIFSENFMTSSVKNMAGMFGYTNVLSEIDLSSFDTSSVENMESMFENAICNVDFSNKNTGKVLTTAKMFKGYKGRSINMSGCDLSNSANNDEFILNANSLTEFIPPININSNISVVANNLPASAFVAVIENLLSVPQTQTLTIGSININKLTADQISKAITKNWSIA